MRRSCCGVWLGKVANCLILAGAERLAGGILAAYVDLNRQQRQTTLTPIGCMMLSSCWPKKSRHVLRIVRSLERSSTLRDLATGENMVVVSFTRDQGNLGGPLRIRHYCCTASICQMDMWHSAGNAVEWRCFTARRPTRVGCKKPQSSSREDITLHVAFPPPHPVLSRVEGRWYGRDGRGRGSIPAGHHQDQAAVRRGLRQGGRPPRGVQRPQRRGGRLCARR